MILDDDASIGHASGATHAQFRTQIVEDTNAWLERARILLLPVTGYTRIAQVR